MVLATSDVTYRRTRNQVLKTWCKSDDNTKVSCWAPYNSVHCFTFSFNLFLASRLENGLTEILNSGFYFQNYTIL